MAGDAVKRLRAVRERDLALLGLVIVVIASGVLLLSLDSHLTFLSDDWELLVGRRGWGASYFLAPYHEHILLGPAIDYKILLETFGMGSALPFYVVSISAFLAGVVLLFVFLRRRVGDWPALIAAVLVAFLGAAFEDLLLAFQIGYYGSMVAGLAALIALDREDERGDRLAAVFAVVSLAISSLGLIFLLGLAVDVACGRRPRRRRLHVVFIPLAAYLLWWSGWGHTAENEVSVHNVLHAPEFAFKAAAAGITSLLGLATGDGSEPSQPHLIWGKLILVAAILLIAARVYRERRISKGLAVALALGLGFWVLAGFSQDAERFPTSSRYQYPSAVFLLLIAGEALRGLRIPRPALVVAALIAGLAISGGISLMHREYTERWRPAADAIRYSLAAVDIAGPAAQPDFPVAFPPALTVPSRDYLHAVDEYGSPAYDEDELRTRPEAERGSADLTLAQALGLALVSPDPTERVIACQPLRASAEGATGVTLLHGGFTLSNETAAPVEVLLGRFATAATVSLGPVPAGLRTALHIPLDNSRRPWKLSLVGEGPVRLCTTEPVG